MTIFSRMSLATGTALALALGAPTAAYAQATWSFSLPAQELGASLRAVARRTGENVVFDPGAVRGKTAPALNGSFSAAQAIARLLAGSGLAAQRTSGGSWVVSASGEAGAGSAAAGDGGAEGAGIAEILVVGNPTQNVDVRRTENDPRPYVVFDSREIQNSNAMNIEDFLRQRLPMNTQQGSATQTVGSIANPQGPASNVSRITLRGLSPQQTLILIDGRPAPRTIQSGQDFIQGDLNGLPLSAIERIEVLPATAGGIYGGGAVGGVINIIRRRDYSGLNLTLGYDGTFRGGGERLRAELSGGFNVNEGRTSISFSLSRSSSDPLYAGDNDLWLRGRALYLANTPVNFVFGSTPNIVGAGSLVLDNGTPLGSSRTFIPAGYRGASTDGGAALVPNAGQFNTELPNDFTGVRAPLLNNPRTTFASVSARHQFGDSVEFYADFYYAENFGRASYYNGINIYDLPADAAGNPFRQDISISLPLKGLEGTATVNSENMSATAGLIVRPGHGWAIVPEIGWARSRTVSRTTVLVDEGLLYDAIYNGQVDIFRDTDAFPIDYTPFIRQNPNEFTGPFNSIQRNYTLRAAGPLIRLPGGNLNMTASVGRREEVSGAGVIYTIDPFSSGSNLRYRPRKTQSVDSAYLELTMPAIGPGNGVPLVYLFELQASVRHDRYITRAPTPQSVTLATPASPLPAFTYSQSEVHSTDFTLAARWSPVRDIIFRGSYSTGFLPPSINQIVPAFSAGTIGNPDPFRGNTPVGTVTTIGGGNPELQPESSKSLSLGVILTPRFMPGFRASVDFTRIRKTGEITTPNLVDMLANPGLYPGRIVRATANRPTDQPEWLPPITSIDSSFINLSRTAVKAYDFQADYTLETRRLGTFHFYGIATRQTELIQQILPTSTPYNSVGYSDGPLRWRGNLGVDWQQGGWNLWASGQYYDSYSLRTSAAPNGTFSNNSVRSQGAERIPDQFYVDVGVAYDFGDRNSPLLSNLRLSLGIQNVFDTEPPVVAALTGGYSRYGDPRLRRFTLTLRKAIRL